MERWRQTRQAWRAWQHGWAETGVGGMIGPRPKSRMQGRWGRRRGHDCEGAAGCGGGVAMASKKRDRWGGVEDERGDEEARGRVFAMADAEERLDRHGEESRERD